MFANSARLAMLTKQAESSSGDFSASGGDNGVPATRGGQPGTLFTFTASGDFIVESAPPDTIAVAEIIAGGAAGATGMGLDASSLPPARA